MEDYIEIGQIVNTYGLKGYLKVVAFTDDITRFDDLKTIYIDIKKNLQEEEIEEVKYHKNMVMLKLKGYDDINQAEKLKGRYLYIHKKDAVKLPEDTYFIKDLINLEVYTVGNEYIGALSDVFSTKSNDVYIVKKQDGKELLLPAIADVIKQVDIENKKMFIHLIKGLE